MKRSDYAPLAAPPNPRADEARAALVEYGRGMLQNAPKVTFTSDEHDAMMSLALDCALDEEQLRKQEQDSARISAALARWPDMQPYAATARVERTWDAKAKCWREAVTVTVIEKKGERE